MDAATDTSSGHRRDSNANGMYVNDEEEPSFREATHAANPPSMNMNMMMMKPTNGIHRDDSSSSTAGSTIGTASELAAHRSSTASPEPSSRDHTVAVNLKEEAYDGDWLCQLQHKLYSHEEEEAMLMRAYRHNQRSSSSFRSNASSTGELCLISGAAGLGKTRLARTLARPVQEDGGYYLSAKFDQVKQARPIRVFADAFCEFTHAVLAQGPRVVEEVKQDIVEALGDELGVLLCGIPVLEQIVGQQDGPPLQFTCQMAKRFVFALHDLVGAVCRRGPMVILFDDLQWADKCSLKLLKWFMTGLPCNRLFLVGTCDDSVGPCHPASAMLRELEDENHRQIAHIEVTQKPCQAVMDIIASALPMPEHRRGVLGKLVCAQTQGNALYIVEFLRWLSDERLLEYDAAQGTWILQDDDVRLAINACRLGDFLVDVLEQLPQHIQVVLRVAACFGNHINEDLLKVVFPADCITDHLHDATSKGVLIFDEDSGYSFRHDGLQKAALMLIPESEKESMHLRLGRKLLKGLNEQDREKHMHLVLGQLRLGRNLIKEPHEKEAVAILCLKAGQESCRASAFGAAASYLEFGIDMMEDVSWSGDYSLKLALYNAAAEMELTISNYERVHELVQTVFDNVKKLKHKLQAYNTLIYAYGVTDQQTLAVDKGIEVLAMLGETFPCKNCMAMLRLEMRTVDRGLHGKSNAQIMRMEMIKDEEKLAALQILNLIFMNAMIVRPTLAPFIQLKSVQITLKYGLSALASNAFAFYGMLGAALGKFDEASRFGQLALDLLKKFRSKEYAPRVFAAVYGCIIPWQRPIRETIEPLKKAQEIGSQTGDVEFSCLNAALWASVQFYTDEKLSLVSSRIGDVITVMSARRQDTWLAMLKPFHQLTVNLMGLTDDPATLVQEPCKQPDEPGCPAKLVCFRLQQMMLSYLLGDYEAAGKMVAEIEKLPFMPPGIDAIYCKFFVGMTHLQNARRLKGMHRRVCLKKAKKAIEEFKNWSLHSPHNCLPMKLLLQAELASYQGKNKKAYEKYTAATALAVDSGFRMVEGMTHEHAGRHLFSTGDEALAAASFKKALTCFEGWGALAKFKNLEAEVHAAFAGSSVPFKHLTEKK